MAYSSGQIATILLKADKTMYKLGDVAYDNMFSELDEAYDYERDIIFIYKKAVEYGDDYFVGTLKLDQIIERLAAKLNIYDYGILSPIYVDVYTQVDQGLNIIYVLKTTALDLGPGLTGDTDFSQSQIDIDLDYAYLNTVYVIDERSLTINGVTYDLSSNRSWSVNLQSITTQGATTTDKITVGGVGLTGMTAGSGALYYNAGSNRVTVANYNAGGSVYVEVNGGSYSAVFGPDLSFTSYGTIAGVFNNATVDTDRFLVSDGGVIKYRTGAQLLSDIGGQPSGNYVPYVGATQNVDLGEYEIKAGQFTLDVSPTGTATVGTTRWNNDIGSSETTLKGGTVILKNGVDLVARVVNKVTPNTTLTKAAYQAVRVTGAQGQRLAVAYAQANNDNNSADTIGLVTETIPTNQEGFIITVGQLEEINTTGSLQGETWADGDVLYLSPTTPGALTNVKPVAPQHLVVIGYVEYAHAIHGKIYVKVMNGWELGELHDVNTTGAVAGNVLKYNGTIWTPSSDIDTGITSLNGLTALSQTFATGTSGTDFNISSATSTHTFNLPSASATNRGLLSTTDWSTFNNKQNALGYTPVPTTRTLTINGTSYDLSADRTWSVGTVTSVDMSVPTGFAISGNPITSSGTLALSFAAGYSLPTTSSQANWDAAYNDKINSASVTGTTTKTLTLTQQDGGTITASWTDINTDAVTSVFGRTGAVVAQSGDYTTTQVTEGTNLYYTEARVSANTDVAANTAARHNAVTLGTANGLSLSTQQLSLALASGSTTGALSSTDWTTFNNKENAITAGTTLQYYRGDKTFQTLNTSVVPESGNLYYTDARSRAALSFVAGSGAYNSTTGVITIPTNTNQLTNGASFITLASLSGGAGISYNNTTGVIASTITQYTDAMARASLSFVAGSGAYNSTTGVITIPTNTNQLTNGAAFITLGSLSASAPLSYNNGTGAFTISQANSTTNGFLSSTDWNTFNNKQNAITNPVTGTGTTNYVTKWTSSSAVGNSLIYDDGSSVGIGTTSFGGAKLAIQGGSILVRTDGDILKVNDVADSTYWFRFTRNGSNLELSNRQAGALVFLTSDVERMRLTSGGNVGIGSTNPTVSLDVNGSGIRIINATAPNIYLNNTTVQWRTYLSGNDYRINDGASDLMSIVYGSGRVGIGTSSPAYKLDVFANNNASIAISESSDDPFIWFDRSDGGANRLAWRIRENASRVLVFETGSSASRYGQTFTEAMRITSGGNLLVGTTTATGSLNTEITINNSSAGNYAGIGFKTADTNRGYIGATSTSVEIGAIGFTSFYTGGGSERMRITSGGAIGIGTTSPSALLHLNSGGTTNMYIQSGAGNGAVLRYFVGTSEAATARVDASANYYIETGLGSPTERMRITSSGLVGINTSSPSFSLDVNGTSRSDIHIFRSNQSAATADAFIFRPADNSIALGTANTERLRINASGNLGLGVTPSAWWSGVNVFELPNGVSFFGNTSVSASSITTNAFFNTSTTWIYKTSAQASRYDQYQGQHQWYNAPSGTAGNAISFTQAMTLDASGRLGIGTTSPTTTLDVNGKIRATDDVILAQTNPRIDFDGGVTGALRFLSTSTGNVRMVIQSGGNVGIGTTSPSQKLEVAGTIRGEVVNCYGSTDPASTSPYLYSPSTGALGIGANGSERIRITSGGNVGIGTTSPVSALDVSGRISLGGALYTNVAQTESGAGTLASGYNFNLNNGSPVHQATGEMAGVWYNTGSIQWYTNGGQAAGTAATERMRITSGGNVGIGTTNPTEKLHVNGNIKTAAPTGYTAGSWKLGTANTGTVTANRYITIEIDGQIYTINALLGTP